MTAAEFAAALRRGDRLFGTLIASASPVWPKVMPTLGLDWLFIDTEHIAISRSERSWMCRTYSAMGLPPVVRVPAPDPYQVTMALDDGAAGVVAPYLETPEQARALVGAAKFRPLKGEKLQAVLNGVETLTGDLADYVDKHNAGNSLLVNIESVPAMRNLDAILEVPGIDAVLIGPHDLSTSLGVPEQYDHPDFVAAVDHIITTARAANVSAGIHMGFHCERNVERQTRWAGLGANLVVHEADILAFAAGIRHDLTLLREVLAGRFSRQADELNI